MTIATGNGSRPRAIISADFNNDFNMDFAVAYESSDEFGVFLGYGNITFRNSITHTTGVKPMSLAVSDFNNDTRRDIVVVNYGSGTASIFLGYGNGSFRNEKTLIMDLGSSPSDVAVADFNNDLIPDIIKADQGMSNVCIFLGCDNGTFSAMVSFSIGYGSYPFSVVVADFNNDAKADFAVANAGTDSLSVFLQTC